MQKTPVPFAGKMALEWGNGTRLEIQGWLVRLSLTTIAILVQVVFVFVNE